MSEEIEVEAIGIEVSAQPIELYKVLKIANLVSGGGEAKYAISEGYVAVNGEVELRKRCKMYDGDVIEFNGEFYVVLCDQPVQEQVEQAKPKPAPKKADKKKAPSNKPKAAGNRSVTKKAANKATEAKADTATGRKPISF
ncbi:RNA-binding S4 domain-containing protein [Photobacterium leiognathi]|uniref:RNA-binding S4 domain-containing protein n=1 Tax=Photobacterium leiognathi TaxID=553611 RepID=UPI0029825A57|nr:RNA-binding S4 domain-containing protein [Photobacterium leiognathi]